MVTLREYLDEAGRSPFGRWFDDLDPTAAAKVTTALARIEQGNFSRVKGVGAGIFESTIDFGPGYRIYFGKDGDTIVILLGGGTKKRQPRDIALAKERWADEKQGEIAMPLTRDFKQTVQARIARDPAYRKELLREGVECLLSGDLDTGKAILRDYINATIGFEELSDLTHTPTKSLMRMLGPKGNPQARNLFDVIAHLQRSEGLHFELSLKG